MINLNILRFSFPVSKTLCKSIQLLLLFIRLPTAPIASIVLEVATAHKTTPLFLFYSFRPEISQVSEPGLSFITR